MQRVHARVLAACGVLTDAECGALDRAMNAVEREYGDAACPASDAEDLHTWIEAELTQRAGDAGRKIHTARSRNDQVATLLKMFVIESSDALTGKLAELIRVVCDRAKAWADLAFPLQTHTQFAAPGTVGFWALRFAAAFDRCRRRLAREVAEWRRYCPLGSGAVAGSSIPIDRRLQATCLGFGGPSANALDATSTRDECLDLLAAAAQIGLHLQSLAADVIAFAQTPFGWARYPSEFGTGSSMMPNKVNPDAMELLRGEACALAAAHGHALLLLKGLPSGYNRDLQCIKPLVRDAASKLAALLELATAFVQKLEFDADRIAASMKLGAVGATLKMEQMVLNGTPLREAHHAVAEAVRTGGGAESAGDPATYRTAGSAHPDETRRVADELLAGLEP